MEEEGPGGVLGVRVGAGGNDGGEAGGVGGSADGSLFFVSLLFSFGIARRRRRRRRPSVVALSTDCPKSARCSSSFFLYIIIKIVFAFLLDVLSFSPVFCFYFSSNVRFSDTFPFAIALGKKKRE